MARAGRLGLSRARTAVSRVAGAAAVMLIVATLAFAALQLIPGDPAEAALGGPGSQASAEALAAARAEFGLDRPILVQYFDFLWRLVRGDLGVSYSQRIPVAQVLQHAIGPTLALAGLSLAVAWLIALVSVFVASGTSRAGRAVTSALDLVAAAMPNFWLAGLLVLLFTSVLGWLPAVSTGGFTGIILPALALAIPTAGFIAQVCRAGVDVARDAPFVESARARGETEAGVRLRHILRHGIVPGLNMTAWALGSLLGGAAVIEVIFARPGLGRTLVNAVTVRDIPVVLGVVLFAALAYVVVTLVTDLTIARVDPRTEAKLQQVMANG